MGVTFSQFFPPHPTLTEANLPDQSGKVFIVTGGASGVGHELCSILYQAGGKVYIAGRSEANAQTAIQHIKAQSPDSTGELLFLSLSLEDLATIKPAVQTFTAAEKRLDVLFNNAGVSNPPKASLSAQGHELQLGTNCLGHYLLTQLLLPTLEATSAQCAPASVRVVWTSSIVVDLAAPRGGIDNYDFGMPKTNQQENYTTSKTGNWLLAAAFADQVKNTGILSVTQNPGNLKTPLLRHMPSWIGVVVSPLLYHPRMGAYTELWAGLAPELSIQDGGSYIVPWGRVHPNPRLDLLEALKDNNSGGTGVAKAFYEYCDKVTERFR